MKNLILTITLALTTTFAFCQTQKTNAADKPYFPPPTRDDNPVPQYIPYRDLRGTIGEQYLVLALYAPSQTYNNFHNADQPGIDLSSREMAGKKLTLITVLKSGSVFLKDSAGINYTLNISDGIIPYVIPYADIDKARSLYLHQTLWLKSHAFKVSQGNQYRYIGLYEPVTVINIEPGTSSTPVKFTLKTSKGETGILSVNISGTNVAGNSTTIDAEYKKHEFSEIFYTENPRSAYSLSPAMWKIVEKGDIYIGMPAKALKVIIGPPNRINTATTAYGDHEQWVYGNSSYYYIEKGMLKAVQN
ncbi:hypothetical protein [Mucilaginibacter agri]|uniref:IgGFc-binding protein N-terminal domain-containing protein n=1 Tax=Mucilaginibacter agri TaxID=2695265 RepID=A0A965ZGT1_9SPHI|nr:hypothetical protein [Mucilaginibacter agri]NCD70788.1 hypothetical protein [Mucilaginibacter agri]